MTLKPWREVAIPHEDVLEGTFQEAEFAADLTKVVRGIAGPEYQDPVLFFERTLITKGMGLLLDAVLRRLYGQGGDPVIQLQTAFGGGKTHTMLAVYHVATANCPAKELRGVPAILDEAKVEALPKARVAVLDGNYLSPSQPLEHGDVTARTLWGEMAYQLGGAEGYGLVQSADEDGTSPGSAALGQLLERFGPAVILIDEAVAYLRQFESGRSYPGGTYDSVISFVQALTEAVAAVPNAVLLASLPSSNLQAGDVRGEQALESLESFISRKEALWKPVESRESFEIVRRRLFKPIDDDAARLEVSRAFGDTYQLHPEAFPTETQSSSYQTQIEEAYPIHPEVFERLYEDWSSLASFQRTRGVLRLMAQIVHTLWREDNRDFLIMPGSIPLDDPRVRNELVKYLPAGWDPVLEKDVDGPNSQPRRIDDEAPSIGSLQGSRRVARTIFLGSAPSVGGQSVRGIGPERIRLGTVQPGQSPGKYDDALKRLTDRLHYLYSGNDRFWYDLRPNLRREMEDRVQRFDLHQHLIPELLKRMEKAIRGSSFAGSHVFREHGDVPDDDGLRLVVLSPEAPHARRAQGSQATKAAEEVLLKKGNQPRGKPNRLIFLAPDVEALRTLLDQTRRFLAWTSIVADIEVLNLDPHHAREAKRNAKDADDRVQASVRETFKWLLVPHQPVGKGNQVGETEWDEIALEPGGGSLAQEMDRKLAEHELVISKWAPFHMKRMLEQWFWTDEQGDAGAQEVWNAMCSYMYLPRLLDRGVFEATLGDGVRDRDFYGYAGARTDDGFTGVVFGEERPVYVNDEGRVLSPEVAREALLKETPDVDPGDGKVDPPVIVPPEDVPSLISRFHGTIDLDPVKAPLQFQQLVEEVIQHFSGDSHTTLSISVDLSANRPDGFDEAVQRTVSENCQQLKFRDWGFEGD